MWPALILAAVTAIAKNKQEKEQAAAENFQAQADQATAPYRGVASKAFKPTVSTPLAADLAGAGASTWAQMQADDDAAQRKELASLYGDNMKAQAEFYRARQGDQQSAWPTYGQSQAPNPRYQLMNTQLPPSRYGV